MTATATEAQPVSDTRVSNKPVLVGIPTSEVGRFMLFTISLAGTQQPHGSRLHASASANVIENLNAIIKDMHPEEETLWILGDDHVWQHDCLEILLGEMDANPDIDIIVPLVAKRNPPWVLVIMEKLDGVLDEQGYQMYRTIPFNEVPVEPATWEIDAAGSAGMLIRREVLEAVGEPWFSSTPDVEGRTVVMNEDVAFCTRAKSLGFRVFATNKATMGHLGIFNVRPMQRHEDGPWGCLTEFSTSDEQFKHLFMPTDEGDA